MQYYDLSSQVLSWVWNQIHPETTDYKILQYLDSWLREEKKPTFNQIEKVSKATGIPLGYFFLQTPPVEDRYLLEFRTIDSNVINTPSRELMDTMHDMGQIQDWVRDHLVSEGIPPIPFVGAFGSLSNTMVFAQKIRDLLNLELNWYTKTKSANDSFNQLRTMMSSIGTVVMMSGIVENNTHRTLDINEFRAFTLINEYAPLIFINSNDSIGGRLFSLLHEFAHICIGENNLFNDRDSTCTQIKTNETRCNAIAAEILVPHSEFVNLWNQQNKQDSPDIIIEKLASIFKCGFTVIARKAYDEGYITYETYNAIAKKAIMLYQQSQKAKKERGDVGGDFYRTAASRIDKRFFTMLLGSVNSGRTLYSDAFRLTNTNRSTFKLLAEKVGGDTK